MTKREKNILTQFAKHLAEIMEKKSISQRKLATLSDVPLSSLNEILNYPTNFSMRTAIKLADALDTTVKELFNFETD